MKTPLLFLFLGFSLFMHAQRQLRLDGAYTGKNLYFHNPESDSGETCPAYIQINGSLVDTFYTSAFEIQLDQMGFRLNDSLHLLIEYPDGCHPKILNNPGNIVRARIFTALECTPDGQLRWSVQADPASSFFVQQYRWDRWITLDTVALAPATYSYQFKLTVPHSGKNKYRIMTFDATGALAISKEVHFLSDQPKVSCKYSKKSKTLRFSSPTLFRIYDENGGFLMEQKGASFSMNQFKSGKYLVLYDNQMMTFTHWR